MSFFPYPLFSLHVIISESYMDSIEVLSVLPFYPFPWEGRSSGKSHGVQHPTVPGASGADALLSLLFPVQHQCAPSHTPATRSPFQILWVLRSQVMA